ncbi:MAG: glycerol kinase GlpK [Rhodospirillum sp.]|nr:glycerol kinase GlpK [Rhodospirillum sp.]MCF8488939.1 glycerol kinase GlpK [Rhodospirillum sp.]MCF8498995.1 glycerol kinase GlpK [Rhodospirillum sp.]
MASSTPIRAPRIRDNVILAIDQGASTTRAVAFDDQGAVLARASLEQSQIYPEPGWVEQNPDDIWLDVLTVWRKALEGSGADHIAAIGLTNQRETTVVWDRRTGNPIYNAISWQDRRGADQCRDLVEKGYDSLIQVRTGLVVDSYFSASKVSWILANVDGARSLADQGHLAFGTIDSFLLWRLTGGKVHATDASNASRTMLFNIHNQRWDADLLDLFGVPLSMMPEVRDSAALFGHTDPAIYGRPIPIAGIAGDQQAALIGQGCIRRGMLRGGFGTGCFLLANTGRSPVASRRRMLATIAYRLNGEVTYALEGTLFNAGTTVQWLRDELGVIESAATTEYLARGLKTNRGVYFVPAFTGLGAPHWDPKARAAIFGLSRDTGVAELARAALESVCYQSLDLVEAMVADGMGRPQVLRVDGGMAANGWMLKFLADILGVPVERPKVTETAALGVALLAGLTIGQHSDLDSATQTWRRDRRFEPTMNPGHRRSLITGWRTVVEKVKDSG